MRPPSLRLNLQRLGQLAAEHDLTKHERATGVTSLSLTKLAAAMGVSKSVVSRLLTTEREADSDTPPTTTENLCRLMAVFGLKSLAEVEQVGLFELVRPEEIKQANGAAA